MISFTALLKRFEANGEKTRWTYIDIPNEVAEALKPGQRTSFRVKGKLDDYAIRQVALIPMGQSNFSDNFFIMGVNAVMRRGIGKEKGATVQVRIEVDDAPMPESADLMACLEDDPVALAFFQKLPPGHQRYYHNWIEEARTPETKTKRITQAVMGMAMGMGYGEMVRYFKKQQQER